MDESPATNDASMDSKATGRPVIAILCASLACFNWVMGFVDLSARSQDYLYDVIIRIGTVCVIGLISVPLSLIGMVLSSPSSNRRRSAIHPTAYILSWIGLGLGPVMLLTQLFGVFYLPNKKTETNEQVSKVVSARSTSVDDSTERSIAVLPVTE